MEINQLRYFVEVCRTGSIVKASEILHITQQGISIAIRRLESELGQSLFYRKSKSLVLTQFGCLFRDEAEIVVEHVDRLYALAKMEATDGKAYINIAILKNRITKLPVDLQRLFITPPEEYVVNVVNEYSNVCADMVYDGTASFGLVYGDYNPAKFDIELLEMAKQVFVVNKNNPLAAKDSITIKDLDGVPLLLPDSKTRPGMMVADMFRKANVELNVAYECNWPHQAVEIVSDNPNLVARSLLADITEKDLEKVKVLNLTDAPFEIPFNLLTKKGRKLTVHEQLFKHLILDCYRVKR